MNASHLTCRIKIISLHISSFLHCFIIHFIFFVCPKKTKQKKGHFAEEFFAFSKNRSKTSRRFAPESRSFLHIFCTEDLQGCALTLILIICFLFTTNYSPLTLNKSQITIFKKQIIINDQYSIFKLLDIGIYLRFGACYLFFQFLS